MYKCVEKKKLSKAVEDDANNLSASVKAMYIEIECNDFSHKIKMDRGIVTNNSYRLSGRK